MAGPPQPSSVTGDHPVIGFEGVMENFFGIPDTAICMAIADAGFPKYKLSSLEKSVAKAAVGVRMFDTAVGAVIGMGVGGLVGFVALRKRRLPLKLFTSTSSVMLFSSLFFLQSTEVTMHEWAELDSVGRPAEGEISFMAEFARRLINDSNEARYSNKQMNVFYRQQLRGQVMRILAEGEKEEELKPNKNWPWQ